MNFLKKLFGNGKVELNGSTYNFLIATINDKLNPIDRSVIYGDPLERFLKENNLGEVTGGGTMQRKNGEIEYIDIEIKLAAEDINEFQIKLIIEKLESLGAPKGSVLTVEKTDNNIEFGIKEGLGIYLDALNLGEDVYKNSDSLFLSTEIQKLTNDDSEIIRYWEGQSETALYFYGASFEKMNEAIKNFVSEYPLCKGARIEKIA